MNLICGGCGSEVFQEIGQFLAVRWLRCRACGMTVATEPHREEKPVDPVVFVSKVLVDLTITTTSQELADSITESVRDFILARLDDYSYDTYGRGSDVPEYELNWDANTTEAFNPEGK